MDIDTHEIREWNEEHYNKLARSYADSQADAITIQMLLAKAVKRLGDLFVTFGQNLTSSVGREYHDRNPAALPLVRTVQGFLPGFTSRSLRQEQQRMVPVLSRRQQGYGQRR